MNKKEKIKKLRNNNGITLIALVVTIIVLIILAGVSISLVLGDSGIITKAKEGKENTELAKIEEEVQLNEAAEYLENMEVIKTVEEMKIAGTYMPAKTTLKDSNGNLIKVPEGFKIAHDSGINVTEGIVIEDKDIKEGIGNGRGNQYVWIPVGENIKKENKKDGTITEVDILLGRYVFADGENHKDSEGTVLPKGTPILKQSAENYEDETAINHREINPTTTSEIECKELKTNRAGIESSGTDGENATALDLKGFIDGVNNNGGYYIARYEASYGVDGKVNSKVSIGIPATSNGAEYAPTTEGYLWNNITQVNAATASRELYEETVAITDLMNSYAWDTAIVYIQAFSGDTDYSYQTTKNSTLANTGTNGDEVCKINDMASNTRECTTESSSWIDDATAKPCTNRGGNYGHATFCTGYRSYYAATYSGSYNTFRSILYM